MSFGSPALLVFLLVVPLAVYGLRLLDRWRARRSAGWAPAALQENMVSRPPTLRRVAPTALVLAGVALLLVGFARPKASYNAKLQEATVVLVLDRSGSMAANDTPPTRFARAKAIVRQFMAKLPKGYQLSLVTFSSDVSVVAAPTHDLSQVEAALRRARTGPQGTALMQAVAKGVQVGASVKGTVKGRRPPAVVVVLSDGGQNVGRATLQQVTQSARTAKIPVTTIVLGTPDGVVHQKIQGGYTEQIEVPVDAQTLQQIARGTSGYSMNGATADVNRVYAELGSRTGRQRKTVEITSALAAGGLVFMLAGGLLSGAWLRRVPW